ncbi:hypothetical protein AAFF_G00115940 [Aldrovandia affinis]|uniref:Low-density lipoprotein receptor class A domain-containing protein 4 n=1 Tax=Aldrovandia affinis TaxID=143900 RepID=A0AAD7T1G9_9TELE|nr:hypothetical protein AAFF_G00115940 [Aldrovandia affinis]
MVLRGFIAPAGITGITRLICHRRKGERQNLHDELPKALGRLFLLHSVTGLKYYSRRSNRPKLASCVKPPRLRHSGNECGERMFTSRHLGACRAEGGRFLTTAERNRLSVGTLRCAGAAFAALPILMQNLTVLGSPVNSNSNVICSCDCTGSPPHGMDVSELEFVQIVIIIVVMTVMVVVIICLLNHYKLSTWSFITRQSQSRRQEEALQPDGCLWPSENVSRQGASEIMFRERFTAPSFMQRDRFSRFQPTYPYVQHEIDLPPTIALSDGEEPPPYQGPCTLQLRDPEQQMELNRESVRAPPNRTIFDSDLIDMHSGGGPRPPSSNSGISAANASSHGRMEGPPPAYSEVMGHYPGSAFFLHQHSNNPSAERAGSRTTRPQEDPVSTMGKEGHRDDLV